MVRPFIALQQPAAGAGSRQTNRAGWSRAGAAHKFLRSSICNCPDSPTAVAPLFGPALLGWRQWRIDIHRAMEINLYLDI